MGNIEIKAKDGDVVVVHLHLDQGKSSASLDHCKLVCEVTEKVANWMERVTPAWERFLDLAYAQGNTVIFTFPANKGWTTGDYNRTVAFIRDLFARLYADRENERSGATVRATPPAYPIVSAAAMSPDEAAAYIKRARDCAYKDAVKDTARLHWDERTVRHQSVRALLGNLRNLGVRIPPEVLYGVVHQVSTQALFVGRLSNLDISNIMGDPTGK